jgi:mannose-6-phosphate isomerase-like protein (cupin superfamily)
MKRIVCGPGPDGRNVVVHTGALHRVGPDDPELAATSEAAGERMSLAWAAPRPVADTADVTGRYTDLDLHLAPGETRFLHVEIAPGAQSPMHRTPHITDYLVAVSGTLTMVLEDGSEVPFTAGDVLVQLGGWHRWRNDGAEPFVMAGVILGVETDADVPFGVELLAEAGTDA